MPEALGPDGTRIAYRTRGKGPRHVVLVPGWMVSGKAFDALVERLDVTGLTLVMPDLRGSGESARPGRDHGIERHAADVLAVVDALGAETFVVVGHSMGGQVAQWLAASYPERVAGQVLLCPVPASGLPFPPDAATLFRQSTGNRDSQRTILGLAAPGFKGDALEALLDDAGTVSREAIEQGFDAFSTGGFADKLGAIRAPTLVVATDDAFLSPALLRERVCDPIAGSRLAYLPGPGHYPHCERPVETAALLEAFLAALPLPIA